MAALTPSQRGASNRRKGASAELAVVRYLRGVGFGGAERAVRTGYRTATRAAPDPGDITGTPGLLWSIKDCAVERVDDWFAELDDMHDAHDWGTAAIGLLVHKRRGKSDPARWWCWQWQGQYLGLYRSWLQQVDVVRQAPELPLWSPAGTEYPMRMELGHVVPLLRAAGYGDRQAVAS